jgi:hypothetical protein
MIRTFVRQGHPRDPDLASEDAVLLVSLGAHVLVAVAVALLEVAAGGLHHGLAATAHSTSATNVTVWPVLKQIDLSPGSVVLVVIVSAIETEDRGFESRQGISFFRNLYIAMLFFVTLLLCVFE